MRPPAIPAIFAGSLLVAGRRFSIFQSNFRIPGIGSALQIPPPDPSLFHIQHHPPSNDSILSLSSQVYENAMPRTLQSTMLVPNIIHRLVSILNMLIALLAGETTTQQTVHSSDDGPGENIQQGPVPLWPELPPIITANLSDADYSDASNETLLVPVRTHLYLREYPLSDHPRSLPDGALLNPGGKATLQQEEAVRLASFQIPSTGEAFKESQFPAETLHASLPHEYGRDEVPARGQL